MITARQRKIGHDYAWDHTWVIPGGIREDDGSVRETDQIHKCKRCSSTLLCSSYLSEERLAELHYPTKDLQFSENYCQNPA